MAAAGGGMQGVQVGRATSPIAAIGGGDRPKARGGLGPSRTDEEIQIVFDRYKASFYRLYNRELRNNPTLQGQMVLRLTIEPDGSVSMCALQSSDMDAPDLASQVVDRVKDDQLRREGRRADRDDLVPDRLPAGGVKTRRSAMAGRRSDLISSTFDAILTKAKPSKDGDAKSPV